MTTGDNDFKQKLSKYFCCELCDYNTSRKSNYETHILSKKHKNNELTTDNNDSKQNISKKYQCQNCDKNFNDRAGLWRHKKKCKVEEKISETNGNIPFELTQETIMQLLKQNSEFQHMLLEQNKTIIELSKNNSITNNTNHTNSHNKTFNLQFFLNETCKNAMNITDFVDSLQLQLSDLEKVGEIGYIEGISNIIIKNLNALDVTERPVHCTDKKRETMYIKDEDKWEKEDEKRIKMHKMVKKVANKNIGLISEFKELHPEWKKCSSKYADQFNTIVIESMGGAGDNDFEKEEKIIKRIAKEVLIDSTFKSTF
jgi:hypothetical protein